MRKYILSLSGVAILCLSSLNATEIGLDLEPKASSTKIENYSLSEKEIKLRRLKVYAKKLKTFIETIPSEIKNTKSELANAEQELQKIFDAIDSYLSIIKMQHSQNKYEQDFAKGFNEIGVGSLLTNSKENLLKRIEDIKTHLSRVINAGESLPGAKKILDSTNKIISVLEGE